jgi:hypothetical protein
MAMRSIERAGGVRTPGLVDPSPSALVLYFTSERIFGNDQVASSRLVTMRKAQNPVLHLVRNAYVNAREIRIWTDPGMIAWSRAQRAYLDHKLRSESLEFRDRVETEVKADAKAAKKEAAADAKKEKVVAAEAKKADVKEEKKAAEEKKDAAKDAAKK